MHPLELLCTLLVVITPLAAASPASRPPPSSLGARDLSHLAARDPTLDRHGAALERSPSDDVPVTPRRALRRSELERRAIIASGSNPQRGSRSQQFQLSQGETYVLTYSSSGLAQITLRGTSGPTATYVRTGISSQRTTITVPNSGSYQLVFQSVPTGFFRWQIGTGLLRQRRDVAVEERQAAPQTVEGHMPMQGAIAALGSNPTVGWDKKFFLHNRTQYMMVMVAKGVGRAIPDGAVQYRMWGAELRIAAEVTSPISSQFHQFTVSQSGQYELEWIKVVPDMNWVLVKLDNKRGKARRDLVPMDQPLKQLLDVKMQSSKSNLPIVDGTNPLEGTASEKFRLNTSAVYVLKLFSKDRVEAQVQGVDLKTYNFISGVLDQPVQHVMVPVDGDYQLLFQKPAIHMSYLLEEYRASRLSGPKPPSASPTMPPAAPPAAPSSNPLAAPSSDPPATSSNNPAGASSGTPPAVPSDMAPISARALLAMAVDHDCASSNLSVAASPVKAPPSSSEIVGQGRGEEPELQQQALAAQDRGLDRRDGGLLVIDGWYPEHHSYSPQFLLKAGVTYGFSVFGKAAVSAVIMGAEVATAMIATDPMNKSRQFFEVAISGLYEIYWRHVGGPLEFAVINVPG
ncbi:MAG: hypothetical protein M1832_004389 [Thelocarpon impressellum]|nr:MAG: hypothetical protein M1832_004389 [Thelocarpon impressellum]